MCRHSEKLNFENLNRENCVHFTQPENIERQTNQIHKYVFKSAQYKKCSKKEFFAMCIHIR